MFYIKRINQKLVLSMIIITLIIISIGFTIYKKSEKSLDDCGYINKYNYKTLDLVEVNEVYSYYPSFDDSGINSFYKLKINFDTYEISYSDLEESNEMEWGRSSTSIGTFSKEEGKKLISILEKYDTLNWKPGVYYYDKSHGIEPSAYMMNPDAEFHKIGKYFQISSGPNQYYIGVSTKEKSNRGKKGYNSEIQLGSGSQYLKYLSYGLPEGYNECMEEIWDFVFAHIDAVDYRVNLDNRVIVGIKDKTRTDEALNLDNLEYFSLEEFFGGFDSGIKASLKFDEGLWDNKCLTGDYQPYKEVYAMDKDGIPNLLGEPDEKTIQLISDIIPYGQVRDTDTEINKKLMDILKKYKVLEWRDKDYYAAQPESDYVIQGDFFNLKPGLSEEEKQMDEKEYAIRSSYNGFIDLYDTEGRRISLRYDNHGVPEEYQEFRQELWDFAINYMSKGDRNVKRENDWRNYIDQAGKAYLELVNNKAK